MLKTKIIIVGDDEIVIVDHAQHTSEWYKQYVAELHDLCHEKSSDFPFLKLSRLKNTMLCLTQPWVSGRAGIINLFTKIKDLRSRESVKL